jgi:hypothetical protein
MLLWQTTSSVTQRKKKHNLKTPHRKDACTTWSAYIQRLRNTCWHLMLLFVVFHLHLMSTKASRAESTLIPVTLMIRSLALRIITGRQESTLLALNRTKRNPQRTFLSARWAQQHPSVHFPFSARRSAIIISVLSPRAGVCICRSIFATASLLKASCSP